MISAVLIERLGSENAENYFSSAGLYLIHRSFSDSLIFAPWYAVVRFAPWCLGGKNPRSAENAQPYFQRRSLCPCPCRAAKTLERLPHQAQPAVAFQHAPRHKGVPDQEHD